MVNAIQTALSGLLASTRQISASAQNIANLNTSGSLSGTGQQAYTPVTTRQTALSDAQGNGLGVSSEIVPRSNPFTPAFDPDSPFANSEGLVATPNVSIAEEAVNISIAQASFRANLEVIETVSELSDILFEAFDEEV